MMATQNTPEVRTRRYSQELAAYTLRQFTVARSSLDTKNTASLSKLPAVYSRVTRAEKLAASGQRIRILFRAESRD